MRIAKYALSIYSWIIIGVLIIFLGRIAYFYQKTSGQQVGYRLLVIPGLLLLGGAIWYLTENPAFIEDAIGNMLLFTGGVLLMVFGARLRQLMMGE
jgi:hypothetical protein